MSFEDWVKLVLQSNVVAAIIVGIFGIVTLKLGIAKFASEKWWERKASSYVTVIEGMHAMYDASKAWADQAYGDYEHTDEFEKTLREENLKGWSEVRKAASIGPFVMSNDAAVILSRLVKELDAQDEDLPTGDFNSARRDMLSTAIAKVTAEAKRDLKTR